MPQSSLRRREEAAAPVRLRLRLGFQSWDKRVCSV